MFVESGQLSVFPESGADERYNVAPGQRALVLVRGNSAALRSVMMVWGFAPKWSRTPTRGPINARVETIAEKPMFREAFRARRCIVPASGFYEWQTDPNSGAKLPWLIRPVADGEIFGFAGIWDEHPDTGPNFCILTTEPNELMRPIHTRMPVILARDTWSAWLAGTSVDIATPHPPDRMTAHRVTTRVNSAKNEGPGLIQQPAE